jgi:MarR family transcriptional regulator, organic hydroperoxide resistance regulator
MPMSPTLPRRRRAKAKPAAAGRLEAVRRDSGPESIGYLVRYAYRAFVKALAVELDPHDITTSQWSVLRVLWQEEGMSQVELAQRMMVEKASLTPVLESMTGNRLIVRTRNADDRRKVNIFLTARGRQLKDTVLPSGGKINKKATRGMSAAEIDRLRDLLSRLITNLHD